MSDAMNNIVNEYVSAMIKQNTENLLTALTHNLSGGCIDESLLQLALNAVQVSMVYSIQGTLEALRELDILQVEDRVLQKALLKYRSTSL